MRTTLLSLGILLLVGKVKAEEKTVSKFPIEAVKTRDKVSLKCTGGMIWKKNGESIPDAKDTIELSFEDDNSGEYECFAKDEEPVLGTYHVKFRTCANCIELDVPALVGIILGNIVATGLIGVSVYFIATQSKGPSFPSNKASQESDRRNLLGNDAVYQPLSPSGRAGEYDVLHNPRRR